MTKKFLTWGVAAGMLSTALVAPFAAYGDGDEKERGPLSAYRHNAMELVKYSNLSLLAIMQGKVEVSQDDIVRQADIAAMAAHLSRNSFKKDGRGEKGQIDSKDAVWANWDDFSKKMDAYVADADALAAAAKTGDKKKTFAALGKVFKNCKACHDDYRKKH